MQNVDPRIGSPYNQRYSSENSYSPNNNRKATTTSQPPRRTGGLVDMTNRIASPVISRSPGAGSGHGPKRRTTEEMHVYCLTNDINKLAVDGKVEEAVQCFNKGVANGIRPTAVVYSVLIKAYIIANQIEKAIDVLKLMEADNIKPGTMIYSSLINACIKADNLDKAFELFKQMSDAKVPADEITYNILMKVYIKLRDLDKTFSVLDDMKKAGLTPTIVTYNNLINACNKASNITRAFEVYKLLQTEGYQPNSLTYATMMYGFIKENDSKGAFGVYSDMLKAGLGLDEIIASSVIEAYLLEDNIVEAKKVYEQFFEEPVIGPTLNLHGQLAAGVGFIKTLKFLEGSNPGSQVEVITGWGRHNKEGEVHKMYDFVTQKLQSYYGNSLVIRTVAHNGGCFKVVVPRRANAEKAHVEQRAAKSPAPIFHNNYDLLLMDKDTE